MDDPVMPIEEKYKSSKIVLVFLKAGAIIRVEEVSKYGFSPFAGRIGEGSVSYEIGKT